MCKRRNILLYANAKKKSIAVKSANRAGERERLFLFLFFLWDSRYNHFFLETLKETLKNMKMAESLNSQQCPFM